MGLGKIPPNCLEIEQAVLGAMMLEPQYIVNVLTFLRPDCFYNDDNRKIFEVIQTLSREEKPIDILIVKDELLKKGYINDKLTPYYLTELTSKVTSASHLDYHAAIVYQKYLYRRMIGICDKIINKCYEGDEDIDDIIEEGTEQIAAMLSFKKRKDVCDFHTALEIAGDEIDANTTQISNIYKTGFPIFDKLYALKENTLFMIGGDKGSAKTNYLCAIGKNLVTLNDNVFILWVTMEDPKEKIVRRFISSECGLSDRKLLSIGGRMNDEEKAKAMAAYATVKKLTNDIMFIDQKVDVPLLRKNVKKYTEVAKAQGKKLIVFVDNFGLIEVPGFRDEVQRDNFLIGELMSIRAESKPLIILIHHLNKAHLGGLKDGFRPLESSLRGSGKILDYVNQCALVNLPKKYPQLMEAYKKSVVEMPEDIPINDYDLFKSTFMKLNNRPDYNTNKAGIKDVSQQAFNQFTDIIMFEKTFDDGTPMNAVELYKRWMIYIGEKEAMNAERDPKYRTEIPSLCTYFEKKMYNYTNRVNKESRDYYLFGGRELSKDKQYEMLQRVFIVDAVKIRDYDTNGDSLIHYEVDLNKNEFIEYE